MVPLAMGMMAFRLTHPRAPTPVTEAVDRDDVFLLDACDAPPGPACRRPRR
jgi:hypothetical protein